MRCEPIVHTKRLGCGANTLFALDRGFEFAEYVIHLEDDTVPAVHALGFFEYCRKEYENDRTAFTVAGYPSSPAGASRGGHAGWIFSGNSPPAVVHSLGLGDVARPIRGNAT